MKMAGKKSELETNTLSKPNEYKNMINEMDEILK